MGTDCKFLLLYGCDVTVLKVKDVLGSKRLGVVSVPAERCYCINVKRPLVEKSRLADCRMAKTDAQSLLLRENNVSKKNEDDRQEPPATRRQNLPIPPTRPYSTKATPLMPKQKESAPAVNRTRGPTMATLDFTTKPLARKISLPMKWSFCYMKCVL